MTSSKLRPLVIVSVLCLVAVAPLLTVVSVPVTANHGDETGQYVATQDDRCVDVAVLGDGTRNVSSFYDYRANPSDGFSSHGTTDIQRSQVSQFFVYHGEEGVSLVFLHDEYNDGEDGGAVTMELTGLPSAGTWPVEDDSYGNSTDDNYDHGATSSSIDWMWGESRTDGGAFRGLSALGDGAIVVSADFGEDSYAYEEKNWRWATNETEWKARYGEDPDQLATLDKNQDVSIEQGSCQTGEHTANLTATPVNPTVGQSVTLDAGGSTGDDIALFHWDVDGDGSVEETTSESTLTTVYATNATFEPEVIVEDYTGDNESATTTVTVRDETPPEAVATVSPTTVEPGGTVQFDGSASTDNAEIDSYQWTFGDGDSADEATVSHTYEENGTYQATLTVTDGAGNQDTANVTIGVQERDDPPTADLQAPASAGPGENVTFDAGNSSDDGEIVEYRWDVGDDGSVDATTASPTLERNFSTAGNQTVAVTVVDEANQTDSDAATVSVADVSGPTAQVSADATTATPDEAVSFDGSDSSDDQGIANYTWEFGDGTTAEGATVTHTYEQNGTYQATLTVTDDAGNQDTANVTITVEADEESDAGGGSDDGDAGGGSDDGSDGSDGSDDSSGGGSSGGSASSGGSSGSTGGGGAPPADDPVSTNVSRFEDGRILITVDNAAGGDAVSVDVSDTEGETGLQTVELVPASDADQLTVTLESQEDVRPPTGTDRALYEVRTENGSAVDQVTYQFGVDRAEVDESGKLRILASNDSDATTINHTVDDTGSPMVVEATTDVGERVVVATAVADVSTGRLTTDGTATTEAPVTIETVLTNDGYADANETVELVVDGTVLDAQTVTVPARSEATVSFETRFDSAGDRRVSVGGTERTISVVQASGTAELDDVSIIQQAVRSGDPFDVTATFENTDTKTAIVQANFAVAGEVVDSEQATVPPDETVTVTFTYTVQGSGEYTLAVNGEQRTVTVRGAESNSNGAEASNDGSTTNQNTGLAVAGVGVLAIGAAALLRRL